ncbi:MAG: thermonuclease family protein [Chlorobiales bacterium]|nr:thermonuclease family protein [Chlorobiales bacterium]
MLRLISRRAVVLLVLSLLFFGITKESTETIAGKVVSVSDGDTVTLLIDGQQEKIRLEGIDCPEKGQAFGRRAKQFTSDMVFGKMVSLKRLKKDRYGRTLGWIQVDGEILNIELIRAGYAWHYKESSSPVLSLLEKEARQKRKGLWIEDNPLTPWNYRKLPRNKHMLIGSYNKQETVPSKTPGDKQGLIFRGNVKSHKFHKPGCLSYTCKNCIKEFSSIDEAISAGYEPCRKCIP